MTNLSEYYFAGDPNAAEKYAFMLWADAKNDAYAKEIIKDAASKGQVTSELIAWAEDRARTYGPTVLKAILSVGIETICSHLLHLAGA